MLEYVSHATNKYINNTHVVLEQIKHPHLGGVQ